MGRFVPPAARFFSVLLIMTSFGCEEELLGFIVTDVADAAVDDFDDIDYEVATDMDLDSAPDTEPANGDGEVGSDSCCLPGDVCVGCSEDSTDSEESTGPEDEDIKATDPGEDSAGEDSDSPSDICSCDPSDKKCEDGEGLVASYFKEANLKKMAVTRIEGPVDFHWGDGRPAPGVPRDDFSVRWVGRVRAPFSGDVRFVIRHSGTDEGVRLWIDRDRVIDSWKDRKSDWDDTLKSRAIRVKKGKYYNIRLEYRDKKGTASVELLWKSQKHPRMVIPNSCLYPSWTHRFSEVSGYEAVPEDMGCATLPQQKRQTIHLLRALF